MRDSWGRTRPATARVLAVGLAVLAMAIGALAVPTPAGAGTGDSGTIVFVPFRGQTFGLVRNGQTAYVQPFSGTTGGQPLVGRFTGGTTNDVFVYRPGSAPDGIVDVDPSGTGATASLIPKTVNGTFTPIVGNFNGDGRTDIFWYAPGPAGDVLWQFSGAGEHTSTNVPISGTYKPTVLDANGDGYDDILWYAPGTAADSLWLFGPGGTYTSKPVSINGSSFQLIPGRFGASSGFADDLIFFNPAGPDVRWAFTGSSGAYVSQTLPTLDGAYEPVVGRFGTTDRDSIYWYRPGTASDAYWRFVPGGQAQPVVPTQVNGSYDPVVTDLDGDYDADIAWTSGGKATIWYLGTDGVTFTQASVNTQLPDTTAVATATISVA